MNDENQQLQLGHDIKDDFAVLARIASSLIPIGGAILGEVATAILSDRQERIEKYVTFIFKELKNVKYDLNQIKEKENLCLFEEGAKLSKEKMDDKHILYIARSVVFGLSERERNRNNKIKLINIVSDLDLEEIQILHAAVINDHEKFEEIRPSHDNNEAYSLWQFRWNRLESLNLLKAKQNTKEICIPSRGNQKRFETTTVVISDNFGNTKSHSTPTYLGKLVLTSIGLFDKD